jgi:hypothetical protein
MIFKTNYRILLEHLSRFEKLGSTIIHEEEKCVIIELHGRYCFINTYGTILWDKDTEHFKTLISKPLN